MLNHVKDPNETIEQIAVHFEEILKLLGEDSSREGLIKTPIRAAKALYNSTKGYRADAVEIANQAIFEYAGSKMIIVKDIEFYSFCEHHILPFFGKISIGYIPNGKMIGLSKLARIVDVYAQRLQVQERLTAEVCQAVAKSLDAKGVIVACNAQHLCMKMRGVEKQESSTTTIDYIGKFEDSVELRNEFFESLKVQ
ncbi:MAG: GTP cyclohydrolase I FolE [Muribaculaceae bacterium]|nr:GTP cyclohydrolase I FolE [Muribaculaceae bacterium]